MFENPKISVEWDGVVKSINGAEKVEGVMIDGVTANMLVKVHDALNEDNQAKLLGLGLCPMIDLCWKAVS